MLTAGSVSIGPTYPGAVTGSGLALALFNAEQAGLAAGGAPMYASDSAFDAWIAQFPEASREPHRASYVAIKKTNAARATAYASAIVAHFQSNAVAVAGVNSLASGVPSSPVTLPIV